MPKQFPNGVVAGSHVEPAAYVRVFEEHPEGALILEELIRVFSRPAVLEGGIDAVLKTYDRGGSRKVLDFIVAKINRARGVNDEQEQDQTAP